MVRDSVGEQIVSFEVLPALELSEGKPIVARLIGRRFDQLLEGQFEKPYDPRFAKMMVKTLSHLCANLGASFGFAERHELSLFAVSHGGEARRLLSRIAGEAAGKMSLLLGQVVTFESRLYEFDSTEAAREYFRWRMEEVGGGALDVWCTHVLGANGSDVSTLGEILAGLGREEKLELLRQNQIEFEHLPAWQRNGSSVYLTDDSGTTRMVIDLQVPTDEAFTSYLQRFIA